MRQALYGREELGKAGEGNCQEGVSCVLWKGKSIRTLGGGASKYRKVWEDNNSRQGSLGIQQGER